MNTIKGLGHAVLAAGMLAGVTASAGRADAMPVAAAPASAASAPIVEAAYHYRGYRRHYRGPAGVYRCGPYQHHTHLQKKACR